MSPGCLLSLLMNEISFSYEKNVSFGTQQWPFLEGLQICGVEQTEQDSWKALSIPEQNSSVLGLTLFISSVQAQEVLMLFWQMVLCLFPFKSQGSISVWICVSSLFPGIIHISWNKPVTIPWIYLKDCNSLWPKPSWDFPTINISVPKWNTSGQSQRMSPCTSEQPPKSWSCDAAGHVISLAMSTNLHYLGEIL